MRRFLHNLSLAVATVLSVALLAVWIRGYFYNNDVLYNLPDGPLVAVSSADGTVSLMVRKYYSSSPFVRSAQPAEHDPLPRA